MSIRFDAATDRISYTASNPGGSVAQVDVRVSGPLFDGRAERVIDAAADEAEREIGKAGADVLRAQLGRKAKHATGHFVGRITVDRRSGDGVRVHTPGLRYDEWLEGVARRNQVSTFKGYRLFREARQEMQARAPQIAGEVIGRRVKELNG